MQKFSRAMSLSIIQHLLKEHQQGKVAEAAARSQEISVIVLFL